MVQFKFKAYRIYNIKYCYANNNVMSTTNRNSLEHVKLTHRNLLMYKVHLTSNELTRLSKIQVQIQFLTKNKAQFRKSLKQALNTRKITTKRTNI